jgi:electron transport complex protein RnfB
MDVYDRLQAKFASHPLGAPRNPSFLAILQTLFGPEEAELAIHMGFVPAPASDIAVAAGMAEEQVMELCEGMADRGLIYGYERSGEHRYCLMPTAPGLFEYPFMVQGEHALQGPERDHLGQLWEAYYHGGWGHELAASETPIARVLPVGESVETSLRVFPFEEAARYVREADYIGLAECPCRSSKPSCDAPLEVCLTFNYSAKFLSERAAARLITPEMAMSVLEQAEEAGLVHCATNTADRIDYICNCCPCCCDILGVMTRLEDCSARVESNMRAIVDAEECLACGECLDRCPMEAIEVDRVAAVDRKRCIGCGLCTTTCSAGAITLERVAESVPPADYRELLTRVGEEKGRLAGFAENMYPS